MMKWQVLAASSANPSSKKDEDEEISLIAKFPLNWKKLTLISHLYTGNTP